MVKRKKEDSRETPSTRKADWMDRRKFLMNAGKYSAAAAGLIAGSSAFFNACSDDSDDGDENNQDTGPGACDTGEEAKAATVGEDQSAALSQGDEQRYRFTVETEGDYQLSLSEESAGADSVHLSLFDSDGELLWSDDGYNGATWTEGWDGLEPGTYDLVIESDDDGVNLVFTISRIGAGEDDSDSEWTDYSDWTDASEWVDNTWSDSSGWKDAGTGTWVAHSDTWYNGEWDDGWLNYGYY
jgi:hypothetical protein